jgi:O-antigen/teichoic acid export membrane protein
MYISGIDISYARVASVSVSGVALAYSSLQAQLYRLDQKHFKSNHFAFIAPLFGICAAGMCFLFLNSLESYFFGMAIGLVLSMVVLRSAGTTGYSPCFDREKTGALLVKGLPFLAMGIVGWFQGYGNNIVIVSLFEKEHVAVFTFVLTIAGVVQLVANGTNQVWSPFFYSKHDQIPSEELENGNHNFYNIQSFGLGVVGAILLTLYPNLLKFFGLGLPQYGNIQLQLALIACVYVISTPWWQCSNYYYAEGRSTELLKIVLFSGVIGIPLWIVIMVQFGPIGIYVGYLVNLMLRTILIVWLAKKIWTIRISWLGMVLGTASIYLAYRHAI